jgi:hypothetical protein
MMRSSLSVVVVAAAGVFSAAMAGVFETLDSVCDIYDDLAWFVVAIEQLVATMDRAFSSLVHLASSS